MKSIHFFVCRHGFGHQKRVMAVAREIIEIIPDTNIVIHCNKNNFNKLINWEDTKSLLSMNNIEFEFELMQESPLYNNDITLQSIEKWLQIVSLKQKSIQGTIILDNDALLLKIFPNALMMGSFLWSEVLINRDSLESKLIAKFEINLIKQQKPAMLCVGKMATEYVKNFTNLVNLPWFCKKHPERVKNITNRLGVLVTAGGSSTPKEHYVQLAYQLNQAGIEVYVDSAIYNVSDNNLTLFSYSEEDFLAVRMVICRPGMGIINDCIRYGIPILAMEEENVEIKHNAQKIEVLGIGKKLNSQTSYKDILEYYLSPLLMVWQANILREKMEGAKEAAEWILNNIKNKNTNE